MALTCIADDTLYASPPTLRRSKHIKRKRDRKVYSAPPQIRERESSLYLPIWPEDQSDATGQSDSTSPSTTSSSYTSLYAASSPSLPLSLSSSIDDIHNHYIYTGRNGFARSSQPALTSRSTANLHRFSLHSDNSDVKLAYRKDPSIKPRPKSIAFADEQFGLTGYTWTDSVDWAGSPARSSSPSSEEEQLEIVTKEQKRRSKLRAKLTSSSVVSFFTMSSSKKDLAPGALGLTQRADGMRSEVWSKTDIESSDDMVAPPPVPARSRLRSVPTPKSSGSPNASSPDLLSARSASLSEPASSFSKTLGHRRSSLFRLPVDPPLVQDQDVSPVPLSVNPLNTLGSPATSPSATETSFGFGRRKGSKVLEKDPHKVRDGASVRSSSSGVYTPPTFPGAQGPRPSHFPSHVYTPASFTLYPAVATPISPSASSTHSSSSSQSDSTAPPQTPASPTSRVGKAVGNIRRFSNNISISQLKDKIQPVSGSSTHQRSVTAPIVEGAYHIPPSTSYESSTNAHSRQSSWGPQTPHSSRMISPPVMQHSDSGYFPPLPLPSSAGLGFGPFENDGYRRFRTQSADASILFDAPASQSTGARGKRKPVPAILGEDSPTAVEGTHAF
ncbi:hypothetical protein IAU60_004245 [Kwoniella sp. DSM 27419]